MLFNLAGGTVVGAALSHPDLCDSVSAFALNTWLSINFEAVLIGALFVVG